VIDEMLDAPVDKVWRAWTDPEAVTRWWALHANIRTEVGGPYELFWEPTHPWEYSTLGCTVTAVEPFRKLAFTWRGPPEYEVMNRGQPLPTHVTVRFESNGPKTHLFLAHEGWGLGNEWESARRWQESSWRIAISQLKAFLRLRLESDL